MRRPKDHVGLRWWLEDVSYTQKNKWEKWTHQTGKNGWCFSRALLSSSFYMYGNAAIFTHSTYTLLTSLDRASCSTQIVWYKSKSEAQFSSRLLDKYFLQFRFRARVYILPQMIFVWYCRRVSKTIFSYKKINCSSSICVLFESIALLYWDKQVIEVDIY